MPMPVVPARLLERPVPLRTGIGSTHDEVTTSSPEAQRYYDQGLAYLHDYVWIEAARALSPRVSQHERRHLTIRERQLVAEDAPHDISKLVAYRKAIDDGLAEF